MDPGKRVGRPPAGEAELRRRGDYRGRPARKQMQWPDGPIAVPGASSRDYGAILSGYVTDVLAGRIVACRWVRLACARHRRDLERSATDPTWPYVWRDGDAIEACAFLERIPHVEGQWPTPFL